jgi:hypothetical protein
MTARMNELAYLSAQETGRWTGMRKKCIYAHPQVGIGTRDASPGAAIMASYLLNLTIFELVVWELPILS